jgi:hypothetical protein
MPLYGLVRHNLHEQVAAATLVARKRLVVGDQLEDLMYPVPAVT